MLSTKAALVLLVAILEVSCYDHRRLNAESTIPLSIHNDNRQYPEAAIPFNGQPQAIPKPKISFGHTPTSSDSKIGRVSGTTIDEDTRAILTQNHNEVMSAIAFLKNELELPYAHNNERFKESLIEIVRMLSRTLKSADKNSVFESQVDKLSTSQMVE
nr:EP-like protein [Cotesia vestalis bracovirus]